MKIIKFPTTPHKTKETGGTSWSIETPSWYTERYVAPKPFEKKPTVQEQCDHTITATKDTFEFERTYSNPLRTALWKEKHKHLQYYVGKEIGVKITDMQGRGSNVHTYIDLKTGKEIYDELY